MKKKIDWYVILLISLLVIAILIWSSELGITGNVVASYEKATTELVCKQQPYEEIESYSEVVAAKNCDYVSNCVCIHKSWLGLGACDSCRCEKEKTVTKYIELCIKLKKWQSPNYEENWLNYPELYNREGNLVER